MRQKYAPPSHEALPYRDKSFSHELRVALQFLAPEIARAVDGRFIGLAIAQFGDGR